MLTQKYITKTIIVKILLTRKNNQMCVFKIAFDFLSSFFFMYFLSDRITLPFRLNHMTINNKLVGPHTHSNLFRMEG